MTASQPPASAPTILLIGGSPRSGTTLLTDVLNEDPRIGIFSEYLLDDLLRDLKPVFNYEKNVRSSWLHSPEDDVSRDTLVAAVVGASLRPAQRSYAFVINDRIRHRLRYPTMQRIRDIVVSLYAASLDKSDLAVIGSKAPFFPLHHDPESLNYQLGPIKYLFLLRNPLHQINSSINRRNRTVVGEDSWHAWTVNDCVHEFRTSCLLTISYMLHFQDNVLLVKYEDFFKSRNGTICTIYGFLGIDPDESGDNIDLRQSSVPVLTPDEHAVVLSEFGSAIGAWNDLSITASNDIDEVFTDVVERFSGRTEIVFSTTTPGRPLLGLGWWHSFEPEGAWTTGQDSYLIFAMAEDGDCRLSVDCSAFLPLAGTEVLFRLKVNGEQVADFAWGSPGPAPREVSLDARVQSKTVFLPDTGTVRINLGTFPFRRGAINNLHIQFLDRRRSGLELGVSSDTRRLGLRLQRFLCSPVIP